MFRCNFMHSGDTKILSGIYIDTVVKDEIFYGIIVCDQRVTAIPLYQITWTDWVD